MLGREAQGTLGSLGMNLLEELQKVRRCGGASCTPPADSHSSELILFSSPPVLSMLVLFFFPGSLLPSVHVSLLKYGESFPIHKTSLKVLSCSRKEPEDYFDVYPKNLF